MSFTPPTSQILTRTSIVVLLIAALFPFHAEAATLGMYRAVHRGHGTAVLKASAVMLAPASDHTRGLDVPLSNDENEYICSMQKALPSDASTAIKEWLAYTMADIIRRDVRQIMPALKDPVFCIARSAARRVRPADVIVHLDTKGTVVSQNTVWNDCVSGKMLDLTRIRGNQDTVTHRQGSIRKILALTCRDYHRGDQDIWQHPDYPSLELQLDSRGRLIGGVPSGFIAKKDAKKN